MSSPPVALCRVCANGFGRLRHVRVRAMPAGFLGLAFSIAFLALLVRPVAAQFPIRQMPAKGSGSGVQGSGIGSPAWGVGRQISDNPQSAIRNPQSTSPPLPAVARIVVPEKDGVSFGSGTLVDVRGQFGLVVSNWHVVRDAAGQINVEFPEGFKSPAQVVKTDKDWDLAALTIYRPNVAPMSVSAVPPQPGDELRIAGYGSGDWRMSRGRCTQYLAPGVEFPHELVEVSAEARQGDSGGPILNQRGELAGVLFGSGPGYTSGSYGGRVLQFLVTVVPGGAPGSDDLSPRTPDRALAAADGGPGWSAAPGTTPQATALHEFNVGSPPASKLPPDVAGLTPVLKNPGGTLLSPPPGYEMTERFGARENATATAAVDPRVAVSPSRLDFSSSTSLESPFVNRPRPFAGGEESNERGGDDEEAPAKELLAAVWRQVGGVTLFDQTKAVLAMIGVLAIVVVFFRFGGQKEREHEEE